MKIPEMNLGVMIFVSYNHPEDANRQKSQKQPSILKRNKEIEVKQNGELKKCREWTMQVDATSNKLLIKT